MRTRELTRPSLAIFLAVSLVVRALLYTDTYAYGKEVAAPSRRQDFAIALDTNVPALRQDYIAGLDPASSAFWPLLPGGNLVENNAMSDADVYFVFYNYWI